MKDFSHHLFYCLFMLFVKDCKHNASTVHVVFRQWILALEFNALSNLFIFGGGEKVKVGDWMQNSPYSWKYLVHLPVIFIQIMHCNSLCVPSNDSILLCELYFLLICKTILFVFFFLHRLDRLHYFMAVLHIHHLWIISKYTFALMIELITGEKDIWCQILTHSSSPSALNNEYYWVNKEYILAGA